MSTATATATTAPDLTVPEIGGTHHFLLRRLHSLTGLVFGGYLAPIELHETVDVKSQWRCWKRLESTGQTLLIIGEERLIAFHIVGFAVGVRQARSRPVS